MGLYTRLPVELTEVDVIVVGGGTAGCVVAARLSDADPNLTILVIEEGKNNDGDPSVMYPILCFGSILPGSSTTRAYVSNAEPQLSGRQVSVSVGNVLGGGSSVNLMMYSRAQRHDRDSWKTPGWTAEEMLPFLKKLETYHGPDPKGVHGDQGPIVVSRGPYEMKKSEDDFINAATKLGWAEQADLQDLDSNNGVQRAKRLISKDGQRSNTAHAYIHSRLGDDAHSNLHVLVETQVAKILFDGKRAVGVEVRANPKSQSDTTTQSIKARKLVVLSAGALASPLILERSGLGDPNILKAANIPVIAPIPGIGKNYQDHHLISYSYKSSLEPHETIDGIFGGRVDIGNMIQTKDPRLGWNAQEVTCKLRPSEADLSALGPEFQAAYKKDFNGHPDKPLALMSFLSGYAADPTGNPAEQYMSITTFTVYPYSRGHVHITGATLDDPVDFSTGFFADPVDVTKHIWVYKKQREIARRMQAYRGEVPAMHPPFPQSSAAALVETDAPLLANVTDIEYTAEDDAIIAQWARDHVGTTWHSLGTCNMAPLEQGGVVDETLGVHGVEGLKIVDLSIAPGNVAANTAATAMAIGEKAADIIIKELGY
ncbi:hypothetical protein PFICI_00437 [Pestalotiopsis fici W106-1]|uniref:Glucose-methanol-choline oxidoreductase N-terminal domain-containing protein n=1 Tax=Pestalotiopsis fici (strain W106-1 / CGMCC3.15140) TaxID=1229662 RepID=W3XKS1_PESFW|nr:uncharacterized protein PFICI_00437 [Pestalotiopsis fici W106-1]ETS86609.1 hypothetical protein PFICI_00437 [Pestalotiopsis fici W106-1]